MTYEDAATMCADYTLSGAEARVYVHLLEAVGTTSDNAAFNLFPVLMHFLSDALVAQIAQKPLHAREGCVVTAIEAVRETMRELVTAKGILADVLEAEPS